MWGLFWQAKLKTNMHGLAFSVECANNDGGGLWEGGDMVVEVVGTCDSAQTGTC